MPQPNHITLAQTVAPTDSPATLEEVREHLRITGSDEDGLIQTLLDAAVDAVQSTLNRQLMTATYTLTLCDFPGVDAPIYLPKPPLQSVSSITYTDTAGDSQTLSSSMYTAVVGTSYGYVVPAFEQSWPDVYDHDGAENVTVTFVAGYSAVPSAIKSAVLLTVADLYENREASSVVALNRNRTADLLLSLYRLPPVA